MVLGRLDKYFFLSTRTCNGAPIVERCLQMTGLVFQGKDVSKIQHSI